MVLTGDSLFVGDVARPDLAVDAEQGARGLYRSLRELLRLEDFVEVWPGHIGGSLCGGPAMSSATARPPSRGVGRRQPLAVACSAGTRSAVAVSLLERRGVEDLILVAPGGVQNLPNHGVELVEGD